MTHPSQGRQDSRPDGAYLVDMSYLAFFWWLAMKVVVAKLDTPPQAEFDRDVRPILERRCQPCHFAGGKMYDRLPFDRARTITRLGARLFTRIKDADEQAAIRTYLDAASAQP
jgi:hypothetical protein